MNSEKVKEIKKVLEQNTKTCLLYDFEKNIDCKVFQCKYILDYINELESENEALQKGVKRLKKRYEEAITQNADECVKKFCETIMYKEQEKLVQENQQLKDRIAELEEENKELKQDLKKSIDMQKEVLDGFKTATKEVEENLAKEIPNLLKQFAERLKESGAIKALSEMETMSKLFKNIHDEIIKEIDEPLKEFIDGTRNN